MIELEQIEINHTKVPYYSSYVYVEEIEMSQEVKRNLLGQIKTFPPYWFIPVITIQWNFLTHKEYQDLMNLVRHPGFTMRYLDTNDGTVKYGTFYCSTRTYNEMVAKTATLKGYEGIVLKFICTNVPVGE